METTWLLDQYAGPLAIEAGQSQRRGGVKPITVQSGVHRAPVKELSGLQSSFLLKQSSPPTLPGFGRLSAALSSWRHLSQRAALTEPQDTSSLVSALRPGLPETSYNFHGPAHSAHIVFPLLILRLGKTGKDAFVSQVSNHEAGFCAALVTDQRWRYRNDHSTVITGHNCQPGKAFSLLF